MIFLRYILHSSSSSLTKNGACMHNVFQRSPSRKNSTDIFLWSLLEEILSYLQVWRILPASVCWKHCTRSPVQAMRQDWIQGRTAAGWQRQQQGLCCLNREHLYCPQLCGWIYDGKFLSNGFGCFKWNLNFELRESRTVGPEALEFYNKRRNDMKKCIGRKKNRPEGSVTKRHTISRLWSRKSPRTIIYFEGNLN